MGILVNESQIGGGGSTSYTDLLEFLYPIGSLYIGTQETCPLELAGIGTWVKLSSGRVLQISDDSHTADTTVEAGLPNITGNVPLWTGTTNSENGALKVTSVSTQGLGSNIYRVYGRLELNASKSNPIYGASDTVQPSAYIVNVWRRTL